MQTGFGSSGIHCRHIGEAKRPWCYELCFIIISVAMLVQGLVSGLFGAVLA